MNLKYFGFLCAAATLWAGATTNAAAQNLVINGATCNFTSYTQTVTSAGVASFNFTAPGCNTGGAQTPSAGTMQFSTTTYGSVDAGSTQNVTIVRVGFVPGGNNPITGTVISNTTSTCTVTNGAVSFAEGVTANQSVTVNAIAQGQCDLQLNSSNSSAPTTASFQITNSAADGQIGFAVTGQNATAGFAGAVNITVARTLAGSNSGPASVNFTCTPNGLASGITPSPASTVSFPNNGNATQTITITGIPAISGAAPNNIVCTLTSATDAILEPGKTVHTISVQAAAAPTCAPTANPSSFTAGNAQSVTLTANCSGSPTQWEWQAVTAGAPAISSSPTPGATAQVSFPSNQATGAYVYQVRANNGTFGSFAQVTVTVNAPAQAGCVQKDWANEFPSWIPGNGPTTTGAPQISMDPGSTVAIKMPYNQGFVVNPSLPSALGYFFINPNAAPTSQRGELQLYLAAGGVYTVSISQTPCDFSAPQPQCQFDMNQFELFTTLGSQNTVSDGAILAAQASGNKVCRIPAPVGTAPNQYLWVNVKAKAPLGTAITAGCTTPQCFQALLRHQ